MNDKSNLKDFEREVRISFVEICKKYNPSISQILGILDLLKYKSLKHIDKRLSGLIEEEEAEK